MQCPEEDGEDAGVSKSDRSYMSPSTTLSLQLDSDSPTPARPALVWPKAVRMLGWHRWRLPGASQPDASSPQEDAGSPRRWPGTIHGAIAPLSYRRPAGEVGPLSADHLYSARGGGWNAGDICCSTAYSAAQRRGGEGEGEGEDKMRK